MRSNDWCSTVGVSALRFLQCFETVDWVTDRKDTWPLHLLPTWVLFWRTRLRLECFDTVGWAAGRASGLWKMGGWWRWALVSPDVVASSRMVSVSASVNLLLHHKVQKFSSGTGSPGWSRKKGRKTVVVCGGGCCGKMTCSTKTKD